MGRSIHLSPGRSGATRTGTACGCEVSVETRRPLSGRRRFRGRLESFDGGVARMRVDGSDYEIPFGEVARGHRIYDVTAADFARPKR